MTPVATRILAALAWAGLLMVATCVPAHAQSAAATPPPLLIAHVAPTTGRFALHAESDRRGTEMAIEEWNARGGVLGREIVLVSRDPTLDATRAAQVAEELIGQTRVGFLVQADGSKVRVAKRSGEKIDG